MTRDGMINRWNGMNFGTLGLGKNSFQRYSLTFPSSILLIPQGGNINII